MSGRITNHGNCGIKAGVRTTQTFVTNVPLKNNTAKEEYEASKSYYILQIIMGLVP
jgi:hypothetical protein